jgi:adenylate kinase
MMRSAEYRSSIQERRWPQDVRRPVHPPSHEGEYVRRSAHHLRPVHSGSARTISTGNILRAAIKNETPVGKKAKAFMDEGHLVPDDVVIGIVKERLAEKDCSNGFILDGVPRTLAQGEALEQAGIQFDAAVSIEISDAEIMERMSGRRVCEDCGTSYHLEAVPPKTAGVCDNCGGKLVQRKDDAPETVKARLEVYHKETEPLKEFYAKRGLLKPVENRSEVAATTQAILLALGR